MGTTSPTPQHLLAEAIIFWSIGVILYSGRMASRVISNGSLKRLFLDDYIMTFTFIIYTSLLILIQVSARYATNLLPLDQYADVLADPKQVQDRIFGSKVVIGLEQCMLVSTWGVKICMLILYWRMTKNTRMAIIVKILAAYLALGFVVIMVTYYAVFCRPFSQYWAMPVKNLQCATYQHYSITQAVFNISSDAAMLTIPIPLLIRAQIHIRKKVLLLCVLSLGMFTISAAIMNKYFNFASPFTTTYQIWYIREASTAIFVANMMCWWPLLRKIFGMKAFQYDSRRYRRQAADADNTKPTNSKSKSAVTGCLLQARSSYSVPRILNFSRPAYRKSMNDTGSGRTNSQTRASSEEAINLESSCEGTEEFYAADSYCLDEWDRLERQKKTVCYEARPIGLDGNVVQNTHDFVIELSKTKMSTESDYHAMTPAVPMQV